LAGLGGLLGGARRNEKALKRRLMRLERSVRSLERLVLAQKYEGAGLHAPGFETNEWGFHSQHGEDAYTLELLSRIGAPRKTFLEIGIQDGLECNTATLAMHFGWQGVMLEGDAELAEEAAVNYRGLPGVCVRQAFVNRENINDLLRETRVDPEADLLSIDIDGNDYWVWEAMQDFRPRVVIVEFNGYFGERSVTIPYDPGFVHRARTPRGYGGASLTAFTKLAKRKGYVLVGGVACNACFVLSSALANGVTEVPPETVFTSPGDSPKTQKVLRGLQGLPLEEV